MLSFFRKNTLKSINKEIDRTNKALRIFNSALIELESINKKLTSAIKNSVEKQKEYEKIVKSEQELQDIAFNKIADNAETINRIKKITGEK